MYNKLSIKFAYIFFLFICAIYYIIARIFQLEFENWGRIICATTIASYFFSIASARQSIMRSLEQMVGSLKKAYKANIDRKEQMIISPEKYENSVYSLDDIENMLVEDSKVINKNEKEIRKSKLQILILNILGFFIFFCILTFKSVYQMFVGTQDFYTLLAFLIILFSDLYEDFWIETYTRFFNKDDQGGHK